VTECPLLRSNEIGASEYVGIERGWHIPCRQRPGIEVWIFPKVASASWRWSGMAVDPLAADWIVASANFAGLCQEERSGASPHLQFHSRLADDREPKALVKPPGRIVLEHRECKRLSG
jgi:hypothetical protein